MNKQQIIYPLAALMLVAIGAELVVSRSHRDQELRANAAALARDLVTRTNSERLAETPKLLKDCLARLMDSPSGPQQVMLGDDDTHAGEHRASARIILTNAERQAMVLRVKAEGGQFRVLSFVMTNAIPAP